MGLPLRDRLPRFDDRHEVIGMYLEDNFRAFRTWGVSATSPWEYGHFWKLRSGLDMPPRSSRLIGAPKRPGFSPDYIDQHSERMDLAYERSDWIPTSDALALLRNNRPLLAYVAGKPDAVHHQRPQLSARRNCQKTAHHPQQFAGNRDLRLRNGRSSLAMRADAGRLSRQDLPVASRSR